MHLKLILKNTVSLLGAELFSKLLAVIYFAVLARYLTVNDIGVYFTLLTFVSIGLFFSDPGFSQTLIRNIASNRDKGVKDLNNSFLLSSCASLVTWAGTIFIAKALHYPDIVVYLLALVGIYLVLQSWSQIAASFIKAQQRMEIIAIGNSISLVIFSVLGILVLSIGYGLRALTGLLIFQGLFNLIFFGVAAIRLGLPLPRVQWTLQDLSILVKEVIPIGLLAGSAIGLNSLDIMMLSKLKGMSDTADYGLAVKFIDNLYLMSSSVLAALFPFFSSKWEDSKPEIIKTIAYAMKYFLIAGMVSVGIISVLSSQVVTLIYGVNFIGTSNALIILVWSFFFYMIGAPLGILILINKDKIVSFIPYALGVVGLNVLLNIFLIPSYSYIGASISTVICSAFLYVFKARFLRDVIPIKTILFNVGGKPLLATITMVIVLCFVKDGSLFVSLSLGGFSFLFALWMLGEFQNDNYSFLSFKQLLKIFK